MKGGGDTLPKSRDWPKGGRGGEMGRQAEEGDEVCVAVCYRVLQCVAVCYIVLHSAAVFLSLSEINRVMLLRLLYGVAVCRSVLQCVVVCGAVCFRVVRCGAACCSVVRCVAAGPDSCTACSQLVGSLRQSWVCFERRWNQG